MNESIKDIDKEGNLQDWGTTLYIEPIGSEMSWKDVYYIVRHDCNYYPKLYKMIGVEPGEKPTDRQIRMWIKNKPQEFLGYIDMFGDYCDHLADDLCVDEYDYSESTKKSRKIVAEALRAPDEDYEVADALEEYADQSFPVVRKVVAGSATGLI